VIFRRRETHLAVFLKSVESLRNTIWTCGQNYEVVSKSFRTES